MNKLKALFLPTSEIRPAEIIRVSPDLRELEGVPQGLPERAKYAYDSVLYVNGLGRSLRMARNVRATQWMFEESDAAKRGNFRGTSVDEYYLAGPVVIFGENEEGLTDVPENLAQHFGASLDRGAEQG